MKLSSIYCNNIFNYQRFDTKAVKVGEITIGGNSPIIVQSMTDTSTMDTFASVEQSKRIFDAGADLVRLTAPAVSDAKNLANIRAELHQQNYTKALVADIHYNAKAAEIAAMFVEKVRINPGNYIDRNSSKKYEYNDQEYLLEIEKIRQNLIPLIQLCKKHNTAIRIGTNHGSLSNRIVAKYGDTPKGMVEATMEFVRIFADEDFHNVVLSLKSSNTQTMIFANRYLVKQMFDEGFNYPIHLGVTEAGDGEDGRIKSAIGIASLLNDGIGDTIRVSLTEAPENEIPVAIKIIEHIDIRKNCVVAKTPNISAFSAFDFNRRKTYKIANIGNNETPIVIADYSLSEEQRKFNNSKANNLQIADYIYVGKNTLSELNISENKYLIDFEIWNKKYSRNNNCYPVLSIDDFYNSKSINSEIKFLRIDYSNINAELIKHIKLDSSLVFIAQSQSNNWLGELRALVFTLRNSECKTPLIPFRFYKDTNIDNFQLKAACDFGALCVDGFVDGIMLQSEPTIPNSQVISCSFNILQASRLRISKTEYISCPGCGRTLFSLQKTTQKIREKTSHLKGLKIGIMGCIVNGPGEMADADFGYVGSGPGKISLYKNKEVIRKNLAESEAVEALIQLIKDNGKWKDKP